ncbi:MAG: 3-isopropylmalate dehydrogenase, partial [Actinobacteria bacterium]|nr:3-isopropylmalate dehydrogenase [Actinomycetota bacterium]
MAYRIATIPGDGIGTEVVEQALRVLGATGVEAEPTYFNLGAARYNTTGEVLPDAELEDIRGYDAILLGAVGDPSVPPGVLERGLLLKLRF